MFTDDGRLAGERSRVPAGPGGSPPPRIRLRDPLVTRGYTEEGGFAGYMPSRESEYSLAGKLDNGTPITGELLPRQHECAGEIRVVEVVATRPNCTCTGQITSTGTGVVLGTCTATLWLAIIGQLGGTARSRTSRLAGISLREGQLYALVRIRGRSPYCEA